MVKYITTKPILNNKFQVLIDGIEELNFASISEFSDQSEIMEVVQLHFPRSALKVPGKHSWGKITLKRAFTKDMKLWEWREEVRRLGPNSQEKDVYRNVNILIQDSNDAPIKALQLWGAWPVSLSIGALSGVGNEILIDSLELSFGEVFITVF